MKGDDSTAPVELLARLFRFGHDERTRKAGRVVCYRIFGEIDATRELETQIDVDVLRALAKRLLT